jgi:hypothetical protein
MVFHALKLALSLANAKVVVLRILTREVVQGLVRAG